MGKKTTQTSKTETAVATTSTINSNLMTPDLNQVISASVNKKDLLEILECDAEDALDFQINECYQRIDAIKSKLCKLQSINSILDKEIKRIKTRETTRIKKALKILDIDIASGEIDINIKCRHRWNTDDNIIDTYFSIRSLFTIKKWDYNKEYIIDNYKKENYPEDSISVLIENHKNYLSIQKELSDERHTLNELLDKKRELPKYMKKMSAELTRAALKSNDKGKQLLKLMNDIKKGK